LTRHIERLREAVRAVRRTHPFDIHGWVVLPDHLHCVVQLPEGDDDFTLRLRLIKSGFSKSLPADGMAFRGAPAARGTRHLAASVLGTPDS
jgi:putative transposase